jgi:hypothetical protein
MIDRDEQGRAAKRPNLADEIVELAQGLEGPAEEYDATDCRLTQQAAIRRADGKTFNVQHDGSQRHKR